MDAVAVKTGDKFFAVSVPNVPVADVEVPFRKKDVPDAVEAWFNVGPVQFEGVMAQTDVEVICIKVQESIVAVKFDEPVKLDVGDGLRIDVGQLGVVLPSD